MILLRITDTDFLIKKPIYIMCPLYPLHGAAILRTVKCLRVLLGRGVTPPPPKKKGLLETLQVPDLRCKSLVVDNCYKNVV